MDYNMSPSRLAKFQKIENTCCWEAAGKATPSYVMGGIQPKFPASCAGNLALSNKIA